VISNKRLYFDVDPDHDADPEIFKGLFTSAGYGQLYTNYAVNSRIY